MKLNGFIGGSYQLPSLNADCQRTVNLIAEVIESGFGKEAQQAYYKGAPGLNPLFDLGQGPIRLAHVDGLEKNDGSYFQKNRLFIVSGSKVFRLTWDSLLGWDQLELGELNTSEGPVSAASLSQDYGVTVFVDGTDENYLYRKTSTTVETFETFTAAGKVPVEFATQVKWIDGYIIFIVKDSNQFYWTTWGTLDVDPLSFATAEGNPDPIIAVEALNREMWLFNKGSTELYSNTGNPDAPFERLAFIENGCMSAFSVAKVGGAIAWLGRDETGQGIIYAASGPQHQRISTHAIEQKIKTFANVDQARAYGYQDGGHLYYLINFEEGTFCYDFSTKIWHERGPLIEGLLKRHRGQCHAFFPSIGKHIVGDFETGTLFEYKEGFFYEGSYVQPAIRTFPHQSAGLKNVFFNRFTLDIETGVGTNTNDPVYEDAETEIDSDDPLNKPQISLRWSNDGGKTWSNELFRYLGKQAKWKTRVYWDRLGMARDRVFELRQTDPVKRNWLNAEIEASAGRS